MSNGEKKLKYGAFQRRAESKFRRNQKILLREKKKAEDNYVVAAETELSNLEYKAQTMNLINFKKYLKAKNSANRVLKAFYYKELHRKLKWRGVGFFRFFEAHY